MLQDYTAWGTELYSESKTQQQKAWSHCWLNMKRNGIAYFTALLQNLTDVAEKTHDNFNQTNRPPGQQSNPELSQNETNVLTNPNEPQCQQDRLLFSRLARVTHSRPQTWCRLIGLFLFSSPYFLSAPWSSRPMISISVPHEISACFHSVSLYELQQLCLVVFSFPNWISRI